LTVECYLLLLIPALLYQKDFHCSFLLASTLLASFGAEYSFALVLHKVCFGIA